MLKLPVWNVKGRSFSFAERTPLLAGILNLTPDSFSDGGEFFSLESALARAKDLEAEGADFIDIGAESSRPGAKEISAEEEIDRLNVALKPILSELQIPVSVDTTKSKVAEFALKQGAHVINDVSALSADSNMAKVICDYGAGAILMHRRGNSQTMQLLTEYQELVPEVIAELEQAIDRAEKNGIKRDCLAVDPGIGFSKTADQSFELIKKIKSFQCFGLPVMAGVSRKSFLKKISGTDPKNRIVPSVTVAAFLANEGVQMLRVHDVRATKEAIVVAQELSR